MPHIGNFPGPGYAKPLTIGPDAFGPAISTQDWAIDDRELRNAANLTIQYFHANVVLPHGARITEITLYGWRQGATDTLELYLRRSDFQMEEISLATIIADWTEGWGSKATTTISGMPTDNKNKTYGLMVAIDPDTDVVDVRFTGAVIDWN